MNIPVLYLFPSVYSVFHNILYDKKRCGTSFRFVLFKCVFVIAQGIAEDLGHVKAQEQVLGLRVAHEIVHGGAVEAALLRGGDVLPRLAAEGVFPGLDLDEGEAVSLPRDEVDLPRAAAVVPLQDGIAPLLQIRGSQSFAPGALGARGSSGCPCGSGCEGTSRCPRSCR